MTIDITKYGPWALITGAAGGQGKNYAQHLAADGFNLILVDINLEPMERLRDTLVAQHKIEIKLAQVDLAQEDAADQIISAIGDTDLGLVVSNAGFGYKDLFENIPFDKMMDFYYVITRVPMMLMHKLLPRLKKRGRGGVILVGSLEGELVSPFSAVYAASKSFVHKLGFALYGELQGTGVDLLVLAPGAVDTNAHETAGLSREQVAGRMMTPEEVTRLALEALGKQPFLIPGEMNARMAEQMKSLPLEKAIAASAKGVAKSIEKARPGTIPEYFLRDL